MTSSIWLNDLASYALQAALLVGAGALLARLFRLRACTAVLAYWQVLLAACLLLPICQPWKTPAYTATFSSPRENAGIENVSSPAAGSAHPSRRPEHWPVQETVLLIMAAGVVMRGSWLLAGFWNLRALRRQSSALPPDLDSVLERAQQRLGVRAEFRASNRTATPITFGVRRPAVLLPENICTLEPQVQEAIVWHELFHVRRRDWIWCICEEFVRMVLWFHPAIWWVIAKIHLTREQVVDQAVIELTESRETYVRALLAAARAKMQTQLVLAPLFLRKGLLKKRVDEIFKEVSMSKRRLISCLVASSLALLMAAGVGVRMFPLEARGQARTLSSDPIQVIQGGENLVHRAALVYPSRAIERGVAGDVLLEVSLDESGQVSDARVLSGPAELRSPCLRSVLEWRYGSPMSGTIQVLIRFQLPKDGTASEVVLPGVPEEKVAYYTVTGPAGFSVTANGEVPSGQRVERQIKEIQAGLADPKATPEDKAKMERQLVERQAELDRIHAGQSGEQSTVFVMADTRSVETIKKQITELRAGLADPSTTQENRQRMMKQLAEVEAQLAQVTNERNAGAGYIYLNTIIDQPINGKLVAIRAERVPQATQEVLFPQLGVHVGDTITEQIAQQVRQVVSSFDAQLRALFHADEKGNVTLVIVGR